MICETVTDILQYPSSIIGLLFDHRSFDRLNMSNHSRPARGTDPPFSHKIVVSITHEQSIICSKHSFAGHVVSSQSVKRKEKIPRITKAVNSTAKSLKYNISTITYLDHFCIFLCKSVSNQEIFVKK